MASAKQIAWRKKFARMSKAGKFKSAKTPKVRNDPYPKAGGSIADHLRREIMIFINAEDRIGGSKASTKNAFVVAIAEPHVLTMFLDFAIVLTAQNFLLNLPI